MSPGGPEPASGNHNCGGLCFTENGGASWNALPSLADRRAQSVALEGAGGHVFYAAMDGSVFPATPEGMYKSTDGRLSGGFSEGVFCQVTASMS